MSSTKIPGDPSLPSSEKDISALIQLGEEDKVKYTVEDFFKNPDKSQYQLSPDGDYYSYMGPYKRRKNLFVQKVGEDQAVQITFEEDRDIGGYGWAGKDRLIYIKDSAGDENFKLYAVDKDGENAKELTPFEKVRINIIDIMEDNEEEIIIGMNKNNPQLFEPYRLNIHTGDMEQLAKNDNVIEPIDSWMTDHEGKLRIASKVKDGINSILMYRDHEDEAFKDVIETDFTESLAPLFFEFDNGSVVYASSNLDRDRRVLTKFDLKTGKEIGEILFQHDEVDVGGLSYSKKRKCLTAISYLTDKRHIKFLDNWVEEHYTHLQEKLDGYEVSISSMNKAEDKWLVRTYSDRSLGAYYHYDTKSQNLRMIAEVSPWLSEEDLCDMQSVSYTSRDGLVIHGYLTLPKTEQTSNLPLIVNPHGGPWVRDTWGYNPEVQLFAHHGYAVFQMNYRGSTGYGKQFWKSSFKQWGLKMQDDITDGVRHLIDQMIANPNKIAIYGGSYGGYATLAGVAYTPELYTCAIDFVGVSNLMTFLNTIPPYWKPYLEMMYAMVGHPENDKEYMESSSPVNAVEKIITPLFVVQGANDPRVNIDESDQIVRSLRKKGVDVPYLLKYDEGHGFRNEENRIEFYKAALGFLRKHMK